MKINRLPISEIFVKSSLLVKDKYLELLRLGMPLIVVSFFSTIYSTYYSELGESVSTLSLSGTLIGLVHGLTLLLATIGAHRVFIMPDDQVTKTKPLRWTWRETRFLGWWIVLVLVVVLIALPLPILFIGLNSVVPSAISVTEGGGYREIILSSLFIILYYLLARLSLVLPATAIDQKGKSLKWSWRLSQGNSIRLLIIIGCIPLLINIFFYFLPESEGIVLSLIYCALGLIVGAVEICLLSLSFNFLSKTNVESKNTYSETLSAQDNAGTDILN